MHIDTQTIEANGVAETYILATPAANMNLEEQAQELLNGIRDTLESKDLRILQERFFATETALGVLRSKRSEIYADLDDGVEPAWLGVPEGIKGPISRIQLYTVSGAGKPQILKFQDLPCGRIMRANGRHCLTISGMAAPTAGGRAEQSKRMFEKIESVLDQAGIDMSSVARTWMWLKDILAWYDDFNEVRNNFFVDHGLITIVMD